MPRTMRRLSLIAAVCAVAVPLLLPAAAPAAGFIGSLSISPDTVRNGAPSQGTVSLAFPDAANVVTLTAASTTAGFAARMSASRHCESIQIRNASLSAFNSVWSSLFRSSLNESLMTLCPKIPTTPISTAMPSGTPQ